MKKNIFTRILAIAIVAMSIMAIAIPAFATTINTNNVKIRKGPGQSYSIITYLSSGTTVTNRFHAYGSSINGNNNWYCITWSSSGEYHQGYVHSSFLSDTNVSTQRPSSRSAAFGPSTLKYGSKGIYVYNMQLILYHNGYLSSLSSCDGIYGAGTLAALKEFQDDYVLPEYEGEDVADGLAGPRTKQALWERRYAGTTTNILQTYGAIMPE